MAPLRRPRCFSSPDPCACHSDPVEFSRPFNLLDLHEEEKPNMQKRLYIVLAFVLVASMILAACGGGEEPTNPRADSGACG